MIGVGEQTGAMDAMLQKIADFYEDEVDAAVKDLLAAMEPMMIRLFGPRRWRHRDLDVLAPVLADRPTQPSPLVGAGCTFTQNASSAAWSPPKLRMDCV